MADHGIYAWALTQIDLELASRDLWRNNLWQKKHRITLIFTPLKLKLKKGLKGFIITLTLKDY